MAMLKVCVENPYGLITADEIESARAAWGCRAIVERDSWRGGRLFYSFMPFRTTVYGEQSDLDKISKFLVSAKTRRELSKFLNRVGDASSDSIVLDSPKGFKLTATPNASYGYFYMKIVWPK